MQRNPWIGTSIRGDRVAGVMSAVIESVRSQVLMVIPASTRPLPNQNARNSPPVISRADNDLVVFLRFDPVRVAPSRSCVPLETG